MGLNNIKQSPEVTNVETPQRKESIWVMFVMLNNWILKSVWLTAVQKCLVSLPVPVLPRELLESLALSLQILLHRAAYWT
jgi:hypothetical protein